MVNTNPSKSKNLEKENANKDKSDYKQNLPLTMNTEGNLYTKVSL